MLSRVCCTAVLATMFALCAWKGGAAESCQDVLKTKAKPITYQALYNIIASKKLSKDEFETTAAYNKRIKGAIASTLSEIKQITGHPFVVVSYPIYSFEAKYDADARHMTVESSVGLIYLQSGSVRQHSLEFAYYAERNDQQFVKETGTYVGSNAFGVTRTITTREINAYVIGYVVELRSLKPESHGSGWPSRDARFSFAMAPDDARQTKDRLEIILIGELAYSYVFEVLNQQYPTLDNPFATTKYVHGTAINVRCAALINSADGKVLQMLK